MRYDIIIANPPYGKIGNEITKAVVDNIDYGVFVNLLPANDYRRFHKEDALWQYVDINSMRPVQDGFKDAKVTTMMCRVNKDRALYISENEFEIENYIDPQLKRYFYDNRNRTYNAFKKPDCGKHPENWDLDRTFILCTRNVSDGHFSYTKNSVPYKWNMEKSIDWKYMVENYNNPRATRAGTYEVPFYGVTFDSKEECTNFVTFLYSKDGFRFISKILHALNVDSFSSLDKWMPKVNWQKPQTVESILKDYGYTPSEIGEVVADLANFKSFGRGMEK